MVTPLLNDEVIFTAGTTKEIVSIEAINDTISQLIGGLAFICGQREYTFGITKFMKTIPGETFESFTV